jgi:hypothetical protein
MSIQPPPAAREVWYRRVVDVRKGFGRRKDVGKRPENLRQIGSGIKREEDAPMEYSIFWDK